MDLFEPLTNSALKEEAIEDKTALGIENLVESAFAGSSLNVQSSTTHLDSHRSSTSQFSPEKRKTLEYKQKAKCPRCGLEILRRVLQRHIRLKHDPQQQLKQCTSCGRKFRRQDNLERHEREQHGEDQGLVACVDCGRRVRERSLTDHFKSRKCVRARAAAKASVKASTLVYDADSYLPELSGRFGLQCVHNPLAACAYFCATAWFTRLNVWKELGYSLKPSYAIPTSRLPGDTLTELWNLRGLAIRLTRNGLEQNARGSRINRQEHDRNMLQLIVSRAAETFVSGSGSPPLEAHHSYLKSRDWFLNKRFESFLDLAQVTDLAWKGVSSCNVLPNRPDLNRGKVLILRAFFRNFAPLGIRKPWLPEGHLWAAMWHQIESRWQEEKAKRAGNVDG